MMDDMDQQDEDFNAEDSADGEGGAEGGGGDAGGNKMLLIIGGVVILLIAVIAGLYFTGMLDGLLGKQEECVEVKDDEGHVVESCPGEDHGGDGKQGKKSGDAHGEEGEEASTGLFLEIPAMIVNLNSTEGSPRYLRLRVQLEMYDSADSSAIEAIMPRVIDQFQTYLRELRVKDLRGSAGIYRLQTELLWRVNQAAAPIKVKDVLFQEILIQ